MPPASRSAPTAGTSPREAGIRQVKVWDVEKVLQGEVNEPLLRREHTSRVWSVTFSPDGQRLASAGGREADEKGELKVWDMNTGQEALALSSFTWAVRCVRFSPDGRRLATASAGLVQLWDAQTGREQLTCRDHQGTLLEVAFSPDGRRLAAVGGLSRVYPDREVKVWDAQTGQEVLSLRGHVGGLRSVAFSPDGRRLASAGLDQTIKLWDAATGQEVLTLRGHIDNVFCLAFSPDGHQLASAEYRQDRPDLGRQPLGAGAGPGIPDPPRPHGRGHRRGLPPHRRAHPRFRRHGRDGPHLGRLERQGAATPCPGPRRRECRDWPTAPTAGSWRGG